MVRGHEEWNTLHITYSSKSSYTYPFDGRSPKIGAVLLNHYDTVAPETTFTTSINGQRADSAGFTPFPNGGTLAVDPFNFGYATVTTFGVWDGRAGPAPAVGETKEYAFQFVFSLVPGAAPKNSPTPDPDPDNNGDPPGTQTARVRFTNLGDSPTLSGPLPLSGTVRFVSGTNATTAATTLPANVRVEVATPYSKWFPVTAVPSTSSPGTVAFAHALPARDDWQLRVSADNFGTQVIALGYVNDPHPPIDVTLAASPAPTVDYRRTTTVSTATGFWRGAVAESEGTFVVFPGQETWKAAATDADARAQRAASRIYKYKFDGTRLWEHAPGWETWGGDMTPDGRFVAYVLNPTVQPFFTPTENKLVLLDGVTGTILWSKSAPRTDAATGQKLESLELALSPDARWIAVGSVTTGAVTLVDRATGNFAWTMPRAGTTNFGQVRSLRFSADSQFLFCGSGDSFVRKLRVSDGAVLWKTFAGGWPNVNGLDLTPDGSWLVAGTKSLDATMIRASDGFFQWQKETQYVDAVFAPDGRHAITAGGQIHRTIDGSIAGLTAAPAIARFTPDGQYVVQFDRELRLHDLGGKLLKTFEASGIGTGAGEAPQWSYLTRDGRYAIMLARDMANPPQTGIVIYERQPSSITADRPAITAQPLAQAATIGATATLAVGTTGAGPISFQWRKDGADLMGTSAGSSTLVIPNAAATDAGGYTCVVTNAAGSVTSAVAALSVVASDPTNPPRLTNLAVRATVTGTPLIVGFSVGGPATSGTKTLLIRGAGPSLAALGVSGALADPRLGLFSGTASILSNDNWSSDTRVATLATQVGAFPFSAGSRDAALAATAVGGSYTAQIASADATSGTALAEIYDASGTFGVTTPRLVNVSARTEISATNLLIAGFVIAGPAAHAVLIRGIGPTLAQFGIRTALADTQLALFRDGVLIASNDNWYDAPNAVAVATTATHVGAFSLVPTSHDAALLLSLPPGNYTAQVRGANGAVDGTGLVEVYEVR